MSVSHSKSFPSRRLQGRRGGRFIFEVAGPELLTLTLAPFLFTVLLMARAGNSLADPVAVCSSALGLFFLHVAAFLFNAFSGRSYARGRFREPSPWKSGYSKKGWASAQQVRLWAFMNAGLALVFGIPALYWQPILSLVVLAAAVCVLGLTWMPVSWVRWSASDLLVFLGLGPLLTIAAGTSGFGFFSVPALALGLACGSIAVVTLQMRQLENLFRAGKESFRTFIGAFDFDRAKLPCVL